MTWPALSKYSFLTGRAATRDDVSSGTAVFYQETNYNERTEPANIAVPQYAIWRNEDGQEFPAILVQAECHITVPAGDIIIGLRLLDGSELVATSSEVTQLGVTLPT